MLRNSACDRPIYIVATLTETRLKQIIIEELVEHYLVQRYLWDDDLRSDCCDENSERRIRRLKNALTDRE